MQEFEKAIYELSKELEDLSGEHGGIKVIVTNGFQCYGKFIDINAARVRIKDKEGKVHLILLSAISTFE